jgi:two-component system, cell cycle sensor histidine kinase and response regulator CckA
MDKLDILLLEDNENDAEFIKSELNSTLDEELNFSRVVSRIQFLEHIKNHQPHLILSDYRLPQYDGLAALHDLQKVSPEIPFIIVTGTLTEEAAADAIKLGAWDYVVKQRLFRLSSAVQNALKLKNERDQIKVTEKELRKSEERFRLISTSAQDSIIMMDEMGRISFWNPAAEQLFGYTEKEVLGSSLHSIIVADSSISAYLDAFPKFQKSGSESFISKTVELEGMSKNGTRIPIELSLARMALEGKWGAVGIIRDISERKAAETALRESEAKYRHLIQHSEDAIYLLYNRRFEVANEKFKKMFGLSDAELESSEFDFISLIAPKSRANIESRINQQERGEFLEPNYEFTAITKDGEEIEVETSVTYMPYKESWATQGIIRDVTTRKELESQLRQAQKMEVVGQLAGGVAHDFNNLLTIISGYCDLLLGRPGLDSGITKYIHQINKAGHRARGLTNQLLAFSRKQINKPVVLDINLTIENSIQMYSRLIGEDIEIILSLEDELPAILADPHQIEQVLMNLLVNARDAIHANSTSGLLRKINVETAKVFLDKGFVASHPGCSVGSQLLLAVGDSGTGMDSETAAKIFEPFFTTKELGQGTGLGLSTVYGIVQQNNGAIHVDSKINEGTTFRIYWPFVESNGSSDMISEEMEKAKKGAESILFVEDDAGVREFAQDALDSFGYDLHPAENAEDALKIINEGFDCDLLIVDLVLPGMSGTEFVEKIYEKNINIPVIYISGYTNDHVMLQTMSRDDVHFIQKPYSMVTLTTKIREMLAAKAP